MKKVKPLMKFIAPILLVCAYSSVSMASSQECLDALFAYGDTFPIEKMGAKVSVEIEQEPSKYHGGGHIDVSTYSSGENRIITRGCVSCKPKEESRSYTYLEVNETLACGIKKGLTQSQITNILGKPDEEMIDLGGDKVLIYHTDDTGISFVGFQIVGGKMKYILSDYYY